jgi:hypothetical protein
MAMKPRRVSEDAEKLLETPAMAIETPWAVVENKMIVS